MHSKRIPVILVASAMSLSMLALSACSSTTAASKPTGAAAATSWKVDSWATFSQDSTKSTVDYKPLAKATKAYHICVSVPDVQDPYWVGVNYGIVQQAKAEGVNMTFFQAGGYGNLATQIQQIEDCSKSADALVIGAISADGLNATVDKLVAEGKPVIDLVNGMTTPKVTAKSLVSYGDMATSTADWLKADAGSTAVNVAWFPGPQGASWADAGNTGFVDALKGSKVKVVATKWGDTGKDTQSQLIEDALAANPNINYIVGTAVTAEAAVPILQDKGLTSKVKVAGYYFSPGTLSGIQQGTIQFAPSDSAAIQARVAIDQAVRALEKKKFLLHVGPGIVGVSKSTLSKFDITTTLAPTGYTPVNSVTTK